MKVALKHHNPYKDTPNKGPYKDTPNKGPYKDTPNKGHSSYQVIFQMH